MQRSKPAKKLSLSRETVRTLQDDALAAMHGGRKITGSASGVCICPSEDCDTQVACDLTDNCPIVKK